MQNHDSPSHGAPDPDDGRPEEDEDDTGPDHFTRADINHLCNCLETIAGAAEAVMIAFAKQSPRQPPNPAPTPPQQTPKRR